MPPLFKDLLRYRVHTKQEYFLHSFWKTYFLVMLQKKNNVNFIFQLLIYIFSHESFFDQRQKHTISQGTYISPHWFELTGIYAIWRLFLKDPYFLQYKVTLELIYSLEGFRLFIITKINYIWKKKKNTLFRLKWFSHNIL